VVGMQLWYEGARYLQEANVPQNRGH